MSKVHKLRFGVIQNNIALKPQMQNATLRFRNRATHPSKISVLYAPLYNLKKVINSNPL